MQIASNRRTSSFALRLATMATLACVPALFACAQNQTPAQTTAGAEMAVVPLSSVPSASMFALNTRPLDASGWMTESLGSSSSSSSSSSTSTPASAATDTLALDATPGDPGQPPPRRRYGRPRYNDSSHNPDGSSKYGFLAGAGLTLPTGNTYHYLNTSYSFQVGAGRNFNKNFSIFAQFDWDNFGFNGRTLNNESELYFGDTAYDTGTDGTSHVWSFSLNPVYNIYSGEGLGAYIVGGVGFYHKVATFTVPQEELGEGYFGELEEYEVNATFAHFTSNAPGFNGGFGLTYKPSRFSNQRLYAEARYVFVDNSQRQGITVANQATTTYSGTNGYPANSNRTTYIPIKFGIRF